MSDTPRTDAAIHLPGTIDEWVSIKFARQLERELAEARRVGGNAIADNTRLIEELAVADVSKSELLMRYNVLREGVEKLAEEYTRLADTSDDEDFITEKRALARELRALIK